jgi:hypothetical protein
MSLKTKPDYDAHNNRFSSLLSLVLQNSAEISAVVGKKGSN